MFSISALARNRSVLLLIGLLMAALAGVVTSPAVAGKPSGDVTVLPTPVSIVVDTVTSDFTRGPDFPGDALPSVVVEAGRDIRISVHFEDAEGNQAAFKKDTELTITSNLGSLGPVTGVALKGDTAATVHTSVTTAVNRVELTVGAVSGPRAPFPGSSVRFDVLSELKSSLTAPSGAPFEEGIGGDTSCTTATPSAPVCGIVQLPRGSGTDVLMSVGACDKIPDPQDLYAPCYQGPDGADGAVVQSLFTQPTQPYSIGSPATIILKCDKTLCGTGAIRDLTVLYSLSGNAPLTAPPAPCPAKGTMATAGTPCVDYVQSRRDGSGDTHLFLLTDRDIRTGIG